ncbi:MULTISPECIES: nitrile hydratase subunit alpha [unclassified Paenibacillus]|uniref:nitrile hydratase subunit alpha n=1 Tax=unclassified Paenibacillus TaxID=185978 RepID=UPI001AE4A400|nr:MULTISPECIES: nitrile hydratase subunit alpha [unclassified Paenibacillus]MBP1154083.1 nitrile hydratase [Paenibacillus sp. PvP091]MBP1170532.1 nitrile hydratase [Paenibacillus sp. PvR098]MBP2441560.1 nitrile hydratase [Paenibacillus sp. PvP052]
MSNQHGHHNPAPITEVEYKIQALESILLEKGLISTEELDGLIDLFENQIGPLNGAKMVARAWTDPEFKARLLDDGTKALVECDIKNLQNTKFVVVENTPNVHNVIVCTLCSCYPWNVLGLPPRWYKSNAYRSRVVIEPRQVLKEFGLELDETVEIRVWDSLAETRYMVLPERPEGTESMTEDELVTLIQREALIGVSKVTLN